tara:strand:+ start:327 stop:908 length:582 start_codon:yes stop_codon:yes gene_type:complete
MAGKKKFTPMLIHFDKAGFERAEEQAKEKLEVLDEAAVWVNKQFDLKDSKVNMRKLHCDMVGHFKDIVLHFFRDKNQLGLSAMKLIEVKEIPLLELLNIQTKYEKLSAGSEVAFDGNVPTVQVLKKDFQTWSTSERQNQKIVLGNQMIKSIKDLKASLDIQCYPREITLATKGFINYNIYTNEYFISKEQILS